MRKPKSVTPEQRCTGHCCMAFPLPYSLEKIREIADGWKGKEVVDKLHQQDIETIADMVYPIDWVPTAAEVAHDADWGHYTYGCRHLKDNGDCGIYERRPRMCRDYPYGSRCPIDGCTFKGLGKKGNYDYTESEPKETDTQGLTAK